MSELFSQDPLEFVPCLNGLRPWRTPTNLEKDDFDASSAINTPVIVSYSRAEVPTSFNRREDSNGFMLRGMSPLDRRET